MGELKKVYMGDKKRAQNVEPLLFLSRVLRLSSHVYSLSRNCTGYP
jgi:hypothetical protein